MGLFCDNNYYYYASRMAESDVQSFVIPSTEDWFCEEFKEFYGILSGEPRTVTYEEFISPVFIMNAIQRALVSGTEEAVGRVKL